MRGAARAWLCVCWASLVLVSETIQRNTCTCRLDRILVLKCRGTGTAREQGLRLAGRPMTESTCRVTYGGWGVRSPSPRQTESETQTVLRLRRLLSRHLVRYSGPGRRSGPGREGKLLENSVRGDDLPAGSGRAAGALRCDRVTGRLAERGRLLSLTCHVTARAAVCAFGSWLMLSLRITTMRRYLG